MTAASAKFSAFRRWVAVAATTIACGVLAACSGLSGGSGGSGATLTLYNGQHVQTAENLVAAFEKQTGI
ncbi:MAG: hypothetical protein ACRDNZ_02880, partial [Streptosporangiaceae bacterium]